MDLQKYRELLLKEQEKLEKYLKKQLEEEKKLGEEWNSPKDFEEWAYFTYTENDLSVKAREKLNRLKEIKEALKRIQNRKYGICESCGKEIEPERLELIPWTRYCSKCARRHPEEL